MTKILLALSLAAATPALADDLLEPVREAILEARDDARLPELERRALLERVATERAEAIAAMPHRKRLHHKAPVAEALSAAGAGGYLKMRHYMNMVKGYRHPGHALARQWRGQPSWRHVGDEEMDAYGLGSAVSDDGWVVMIAVFVDDGVPYDGPALEREVVVGVNAMRAEHGLGPLTVDEALSRVARAHSEDMARREFVEHRNPDGLAAADRLARAGIAYRSMAENINMSRGHRHPARVAVEGWMGSPGHREAILSPGFATTGVGVARGADGKIYFTQLFLRP